MRVLVTSIAAALVAALPVLPHAAAAEPSPSGCPQTSGGVPVMPWDVDLNTAEQDGSLIPYTQPDSIDPGPGWIVASTGNPAYSVAPAAPWITSTDANWINSSTTNAPTSGGVVVDPDSVLRRQVDLGPITVLPGSTRFRTYFTVPDLAFRRSLQLEFAADNGVTFYLNGLPIGGYEPGPTASVATQLTAFDQFHTLAVAETGFVTGVNRLDAVVTNYGGPTGLLVVGRARGCVPGVDFLPGTRCIHVTQQAGLTTTPAAREDVGTVTNTGWTTTAPVAGPVYPVSYRGWIPGPWIARTADPHFAGSATYEVTFTMANGATNQALDLQVAADNQATFYLNGTVIGTTGLNTFTAKQHLFWAGPGFVAGTNTLRAVVTDDGVVSGLLVQGAAVSCPPET